MTLATKAFQRHEIETSVSEERTFEVKDGFVANLESMLLHQVSQSPHLSKTTHINGSPMHDASLQLFIDASDEALGDGREDEAGRDAMDQQLVQHAPNLEQDFGRLLLEDGLCDFGAVLFPVGTRNGVQSFFLAGRDAGKGRVLGVERFHREQGAAEVAL
jgi:hypothetical protein